MQVAYDVSKVFHRRSCIVYTHLGRDARTPLAASSACAAGPSDPAPIPPPSTPPLPSPEPSSAAEYFCRMPDTRRSCRSRLSRVNSRRSASASSPSAVVIAPCAAACSASPGTSGAGAPGWAPSLASPEPAACASASFRCSFRWRISSCMGSACAGKQCRSGRLAGAWGTYPIRSHQGVGGDRCRP